MPALLAAFRTTRHGALFLLEVTHGLRQGKALGLRWTDVDLKAKHATIRQSLQWAEGKATFVEPKTLRSRRAIPLADDVVKALKTHRKTQLETG
jgi:integrase